MERHIEILFAWLVSIGLVGLAFAVLGIFKSPQAVVGGTLVTLVYGHLTRKRTTMGLAPPVNALPVLLLLLTGLFFRVPAIDYASGGQDQGVYVNMAAHIVRTGGFSIDDTVASRLQGSDALPAYEADNAPVNGDFLLGIFDRPTLAGPHLEFQFYHLFPVFMAVTGGLFGLDHGVAALTVLSLFSLVCFYCLAIHVTGDRRLAFLAALLLAINPLHAFFSRFPVTEVPMLCFVLGSAWLLMRAWRNDGDSTGRWLQVLLSVAALGCAFLIRMTGFMYIPVILLIGVAGCLFEQDQRARRVVFVWSLSANTAYLMTLIYGHLYSPVYTSFHLNYAFGFLGAHWDAWLLSAWGGSIAFLCAVYRAPPDGRMRQNLKQAALRMRGWFGPMVIIAVVLWAYKLYVLGWTHRYAADPWLAQRWAIAGTKFGVLRYSTLVVAVEYAGPVVLLLFLGTTWAKSLPGVLGILGAFVLMFLFYVAGPQYLVAYQPYYARYLASDFLPFVILLVVAAIPHMRARSARGIAYAGVGGSAVLGLLLCAGQLRANEQHGMAESYDRVASHVGQDDLLLLDVSSLSLPHQLIEMPFLLREGLYVGRISQTHLADIHYLNVLQSRFDRVFMLSGRPDQEPGFQPVDSVHFREWVAEQGTHPPIRSTTRFQGRTYLYVRPAALIEPSRWISISDLGGTASGSEWHKVFSKGWSLPEAWGMWSDGAQAHLDVPAELADGSTTRVLRLRARPYVTANHPVQRLRVSVDGNAVREEALSTESTLEIPLGNPSVVTHHVVFDLPDAITPANAGANSNDVRQLGIGVLSAQLDVAPSGP